MGPKWRTPTVVALCQRMLDSREFDVLPILADALTDAEYTDDELLAACRDPHLNPVLAERVVNLVYSDETAAAVRWLEQFARDICYEGEEPPAYNYEGVVQLGRDGVSSGEMSFYGDAGEVFLEEEGNRREFFRNWSLVTGVAVPAQTQDRITFSCAC